MSLYNQSGIIPPGETWTSLPTTSLGRSGGRADKDYSVDPATHHTDTITEVMAVKNTSGGTLVAGTVVKFDTTTPAMFKYVNATAGAGEHGDGVVDEFVGTGGVPSNEYFNLIRKGCCKVRSSSSAAIAVGDPLRVAASGEALEDSVGSGASVFGYAIAASSAADTLFRAYVDFTGPNRAPTSGSPELASATFVVGAEASNAITVTVQLTDTYGVDLAYKAVVNYYISSDTAGDTVGGDVGDVDILTDGTIIAEYTQDIKGLVRSEADGDIDFNFQSTGTSTVYLNLVMPNGSTVQSGAITFA